MLNKEHLGSASDMGASDWDDVDFGKLEAEFAPPAQAVEEPEAEASDVEEVEAPQERARSVSSQ